MPNTDTDICGTCVGDPALRALIRTNGTVGQCDYCDKTRKLVSIANIGERFVEMLSDLYQVTPSEPSAFEYAMMRENGGDFWFREGQSLLDLIIDEAKVSERAAKDIREVILEDIYDEDTHDSYFGDDPHFVMKESGPGELVNSWNALVRSIKRESRMLGGSALSFVKQIFHGIDRQSTFKGSPIVSIGPGFPITKLYRARVFQRDLALKRALADSARELGPPPPIQARAGRMNFQGISVFYGATSRAMARAEVRPPMGSRVLIGAFRPLREMRLLDIGALSSSYPKGSSFSANALQSHQRSAFLRVLCEHIVAPVMPDHEEEDYLATQVISEYLASHPTLRLDGVLYPSAQQPKESPERNVVLFHKSSKIRTNNPRTVSDVELYQQYSEDGPEFYPTVYVKKPMAAAVAGDSLDDKDPSDDDPRDDALRLLRKSLRVHTINSVRYSASPSRVTVEEEHDPPARPPDF